MTARAGLAPADCDMLVLLFDRAFFGSHNTRLVRGGEEPIYLPADGAVSYHRIIFTRDYFSSALHEVAHWCVAGPERRLLEDYGYWYAPDGRTEAQQQAFERVEVKPQALEWMFTRATGRDFRPSADNLDAGLGPSDTFKDRIHAQVVEFCDRGLNPRARRFARVLAEYYGTGDPLLADAYRREVL